jgi:hypothetical protein
MCLSKHAVLAALASRSARAMIDRSFLDDELEPSSVLSTLRRAVSIIA